MNDRANVQQTQCSSQAKSVRFLKLLMNDYGNFQGRHEFEFTRQKTLIVVDSGAGATTAAKTLVHLGPVKGIEANNAVLQPKMSALVETEGNRQLIHTYRNLIYLSDESAADLALHQESAFSMILNRNQQRTVSDAAQTIFQSLQAGKFELPADQDLSVSRLSGGQMACLGYVLILTARQTLELDIPVVCDEICLCLTQELRRKVWELIRRESRQQIIFFRKHLGQEALREMGQPDYHINCPAQKRPQLF